MIDVKNNIHYPSGYPISQHPPVFLCSSPGPDPYCSQDLYNPVYEELSDADSEMGAVSPLSEDEFAEDELSLGGDIDRHLKLTGGENSTYKTTDSLLIRNRDNQHHHHQLLHHQQQRYRRPQEPLPPLPNNSLSNNNKRHHHNQHSHNNNNRSLDRRGQQEFHEGMLLNALLQLYPRVGSVGGGTHEGRRQIPSITQRLQCISPTPGPYETVPVIGHLATFRPIPKPYSNDSAFGSDSGYSNHTSGTRGSSRGRRDPRRLSQLSAELALT